jgi:hypothetical protein
VVCSATPSRRTLRSRNRAPRCSEPPRRPPHPNLSRLAVYLALQRLHSPSRPAVCLVLHLRTSLSQPPRARTSSEPLLRPNRRLRPLGGSLEVAMRRPSQTREQLVVYLVVSRILRNPPIMQQGSVC